jgi:hypothetical protein
MISLYTLLPRIACNPNKYIADDIMASTTFKTLLASWRKSNNPDMSDAKYLCILGKYLNTILSNRNKIGLTPENTLTIDLSRVDHFHNYSGIVSLCQGGVNHVQHIRVIRKKMRELHRKKNGVKKAVK